MAICKPATDLLRNRTLIFCCIPPIWLKEQHSTDNTYQYIFKQTITLSAGNQGVPMCNIPMAIMATMATVHFLFFWHDYYAYAT